MKRKKLLTALLYLIMITALVFAMAACANFEQDTTPGGSIVVGTYPTARSADETTDEPTDESPPVASEQETTEGGTDATAMESPPDVTEENYIYVNPLTGEEAALDPSGMRPIAIVVDNASGALAHQRGLCDADVLIETLTAPGITRFLAIYSDFRLMPTVCNVRAGRAHDVKIAKDFNAVLISHGGLSSTEKKYDFLSTLKALFGSSDAFIDASKDPAWSASNGNLLKTIVYYDENYRTDLKYDTIVTKDSIDLSLIDSAFASAGFSIDGDAVSPFKLSDGSADGENGVGVTLSFTASGVNSSLIKSVTFRYSAEKGTYLRFEDSRPHIDSATGEQLSFKNVIALLTDAVYIAGESDVDPLTTDIAVYGSGTGYYLCGGKCVPLIWINTAETGLKLYSPDGELSISSGNTYVGYLNSSYADAVKISQ